MRRERPRAARLVDARQQRLVAVAQVLDIVDVEFGGLGLEDCGRSWRVSLSVVLLDVTGQPSANPAGVKSGSGHAFGPCGAPWHGSPSCA